jgi:predicted DNA-binding transcriptional regulator YafY
MEDGYLTGLALKLIERENLPAFELKTRRDLLRKDIEFILNPYQILSENSMRNGYFLGTGILTQNDLKQVFSLVQTQAKNIDDPLALEVYEEFQRRMKIAKLQDNYVYPVRGIANRSVVDTDFLDSQTLSHKLDKVTQIIEERKLVKLNKFSNRPGYETEVKGGFSAWLLQITFYNFAWYLGFEHHGGEQDGLFRFERLDRLYLEQEYEQTRTEEKQKTALAKLTKLLSASAGIYLGNDPQEQRIFLRNDPKEKKAIQTTVELWFSEDIFAFIAEGTKRFPPQQMKMSLPPNSLFSAHKNKSLFCLNKRKNQIRPYRFQVTLPKWSLNEFDFLRWILGFGGKVEVYKPTELRDKIIQLSQESLNVYQHNTNNCSAKEKLPQTEQIRSEPRQ